MTQCETIYDYLKQHGSITGKECINLGVSKTKKPNPRKIPRTQEDVDRAKEQGVVVGVSNACAIFMTVLLDKFDGANYIVAVWNEINKLSSEVKEKRVSIPDLRNTLREEYGIEV